MESALADLPADLRWLFESGAVTIEQLAALYAELGSLSAADLADAVQREAVATVPGLNAAVEHAVAAALGGLRHAIPRIPLGRAVRLVESLASTLLTFPGIDAVTPVGSLRRGQDTVGDIEMIAPTRDPAAAIDHVARLPQVMRVLHRSERRLYVHMERAQVGLRFPRQEEAGSLLLHLTGSAAHVAALGRLARERGATLSREGLRLTADGPLISASEEAIYAALGLPFIPPEIRERGDEIEAAAHGPLPALVSASDIRGDLHMHTSYSDGRDSVAVMVEAGRALGYEYMAITDHSPHSASSRNLTLDSVKRQADDIAAAREAHPDIAILHGCEVDILADGRLDFPDRVLERFDIVLASLHEHAGHSSDRLLRRYLAAVRHPLVALITHPTNRLIPFRPGYDLDYDRLLEAAAATGTLIEIDGSPAHLDMDGALARRAVAAGVSIAVSSDCHRGEHLAFQMHLGVTTARRGWVEPRHVVNTWPLADVRATLSRKRAKS